ncbi:hypothetical protein KL86DYS1_10020 [uncultured Dysgonomonas sp.]|uniref:Uncharacterized protein n=1 Tax=uncultured Dysgonomonas sp. TaxID=206096 RepID=A0A212IT27_9BACT|nr:hypothetical protein KL86DYS1_10020 [uncultured Dysgonomonas sp.]
MGIKSYILAYKKWSLHIINLTPKIELRDSIVLIRKTHLTLNSL